MAVSEQIEVALDEDVKLIRESGETDRVREESKSIVETNVLQLNAEYYREIAGIIEGLQRENLQKITQLLTKTLSVQEGKETGEFISTVLHLFNTVLREAFFKTFLQDLFKKTQTRIPLEDTKFKAELAAYAGELEQSARYKKGVSLFEKMFSTFAIDLQSSIIDSLEKNKGFEDLIEATQNEFKNIFSKMDQAIFINFLRIFNRSFIYEIEESVNFLKAYPEKWEYDDYSETAETFFSRTVYTIQHTFDTIKTALRKTQESKKITLHQPIPIVEKVSGIELLNPILRGYLVFVMRDTSQDNPLKDHLGSIVKVISTIKSKPRRRHSAQTFSSLHRDPHSGRGSSVPSIMGEGPIVVDMGGGRGQQWFLHPTANVSMVTGTDEQNYLDEEDQDTKNSEEAYQYQLLSGAMPSIRRRLKCCPVEDQEKFAALCVRNPFVEGINDGRALHDSVSQVLKLYPDARSKVLPYLIICDTVGGTIGGLIGRDAILNPKKPLSVCVRVWKGVTGGTVLLTFSMGMAIKIYLAVNPSEDTISDKEFWSELAVGPVIAFLGKSVWDSISPTTKDRWFPQDTRWRYVRGTVDGFLDFLYYGRIFDISLLNFFDISGHPIYQWISSPLALLTTLIKRLTRYRETTDAVMTYLAAANFSYSLFKEDLLPNGSEDAELSPLLTYAYRIYWPSSFGTSLIVMLRHGVSFTREFEVEPKDVVTRRVKVRSNSSTDARYLTINSRDYQLLVEFTQTERKKVEKHQHRRGSRADWAAYSSSSPSPITYMRQHYDEGYDSRRDFPSQSTISDPSELTEGEKKKEQELLSDLTESAYSSSSLPPITYQYESSRESSHSRSTASDPPSNLEGARGEEDLLGLSRPSIRRKKYCIPCRFL